MSAFIRARKPPSNGKLGNNVPFSDGHGGQYNQVPVFQASGGQ